MRFLLLLLTAVVSGCTCPGRPCLAEGTATLVITATGLPAGVESRAQVQLSDDSTLEVVGSRTVELRAGLTLVTTSPLIVSDRRVRSVYVGTVTGDFSCLVAGAQQDVSISWAKVPTSNRLWVGNANASAQVVGFDASVLSASGTQAASIAARGSVGGALAFDALGNLWGIGPTTVDATLVRYPAAAFATSATIAPDTQVQLDFGCVPLANGLVLSKQGAAYVSSPCRNAVYRVPASQLTPGARRTVQPTWAVEVQGPGGMTFDAAGNLWVASTATDRLLRFDAATLVGETAPTGPSFALGVLARDLMGDTSLFSPSWIAFDANGALWANDFGANTFYRVPASALSGIGTQAVQPAVRVVVGVTAVMEGFLFDEGGGLWSAGSQGRVIRLSPAQLMTSSTSGSPTAPELVLQSGDLGSAANLAIYPAPAALPLLHALP